MAPPDPEKKLVAENRKARHDYSIEDSWEAGLVLQGSEVKSLRQGKLNLGDAYVYVKNGEAFVTALHIPPYAQANRFGHEPLRERKLLLHAAEIAKIADAVDRKGYAIVPLELYFLRGRAKLRIGLGKGRQQHDKRDVKKEADAKREVARAMRNGRR
jgi:SsrA-binding protein